MSTALPKRQSTGAAIERSSAVPDVAVFSAKAYDRQFLDAARVRALSELTLLPVRILPLTGPKVPGRLVRRLEAGPGEDFEEVAVVDRDHVAGYAPLREIILNAESADDCIAKVRAWLGANKPPRATEIMEQVLSAYAAQGVLSVRRNK